jgi:hypothetical protein
MKYIKTALTCAVGFACAYACASSMPSQPAPFSGVSVTDHGPEVVVMYVNGKKLTLRRVDSGK